MWTMRLGTKNVLYISMDTNLFWYLMFVCKKQHVKLRMYQKLVEEKMHVPCDEKKFGERTTDNKV